MGASSSQNTVLATDGRLIDMTPRLVWHEGTTLAAMLESDDRRVERVRSSHSG